MVLDGADGRWRWMVALSVGFGVPFIETFLSILSQAAIAAYSPEAL